MPIIPLNDRKVASLTPAAGRVDYVDRTFPGFGLRITPNGVKTFFVRYRVNGRQARLTLGKYPAVTLKKGRDEAKKALGKVALGLDPMADKRTAVAQTFGALAEFYIQKHAKIRKRSWRDDARMIRTELAGWKHRQAGSIRRREVRALLDDIVDRGAPVGANRVLALVRKIFNFGLDREWLEVNPAHRMAAPADEQSRTRVLKADEIRALWAWLDRPADADAPAAEQRLHRLNMAALKLRLITAQRGSEVLALRWEHIDGDWWTIPAQVAKNGLSHRVPLTPMALAVLETVKADNPAGGLFVGIVGTRQRRGLLADFPVDDVRPHDFRRTAASLMAGAGVERFVIAKVLNHVDPSVTAIYDRHGYDAEKRTALEKWDAILTSILAPP